MTSDSIKTYISVATIVFGFAAIFALSNFLENQRPEISEAYIDEDLSLQGEKLKGWSLGYEGLIADWYWVRSLQYMGYKISKSKEQTINLEDLTSLDPRLLYPLLDNATTLDPQFMAAYSYGAIVLPAIDPEQAIKIAEKGIKNNPDSWRLYQHLGYIYWRLKKYEKASETYEKGSKITDAPNFFKFMAARMKTAGGSRETARGIYRQMLDLGDSRVKETANLRLLQMDFFDQRDIIREVLKSLKKSRNSCVDDLKEIAAILQKIKLPENIDFRINQKGELVDPTDAPYLLDQVKCDIKLDAKLTKLPLS